METFCTEPLLVRGFNITFCPKKDFPRKKKTLLNISFLNIPAETPDESLTEYYCNSLILLETPYILKKTTTEYLTTPVPESSRLIDCTNIYHDTSTICLDETCYVFTPINRQINLEKGIT